MDKDKSRQIVDKAYEILKAQEAIAGLLKELFLVPRRLRSEEMIVMFSNIMLDQVEKSFTELKQLIGEDEE